MLVEQGVYRTQRRAQVKLIAISVTQARVTKAD